MEDSKQALARVLAQQRPIVLARVIRVVGGDFAAAEELVRKACLAAWNSWPNEGIPDEPRAWLTRVAKNRAVDRLRRSSRWHDRYEALLRWITWTDGKRRIG